MGAQDWVVHVLVLLNYQLLNGFNPILLQQILYVVEVTCGVSWMIIFLVLFLVEFHFFENFT